ELRITLEELVLQQIARPRAPAGHAADRVEPSVQVDHPALAGDLVEPVDVLRDDELDAVIGLETRERGVRAVRARAAKARPADAAPCPIALPGVGIADERLERHRSGALPRAVCIPVVRNAGLGAAARARQHEEAAMVRDEALEVGNAHPCSLKNVSDTIVDEIASDTFFR